jgi:cyanophycinase
MRLFLSCTAVPLLAVILSAQVKPEAKPYEYFRAGKTNARQVHGSAGFLLAGGGNTPEAAYRWFVQKAGGGEAVTLRASGADAMNKVLLDAGTVESAVTLLFHDKAASSDPFVVETIRKASALFIAGGDQWKYVSMWKDTPVAAAINDLIRRGVPIGGTSAGLAVLGEFSFSAEHDSITSKQALANPFDPSVTIADHFIQIPLLRGIITDTHWVKRDRLGRTLVFLARMVHDGKARPASAIAVDEANAVLLSPDGSAVVSGAGCAYFLRTTEAPEVCEPDRPLTMRNISVYRIDATGSFHVKKWQGKGGVAYMLSVEDGVVRSTQPGGAIY